MFKLKLLHRALLRPRPVTTQFRSDRILPSRKDIAGDRKLGAGLQHVKVMDPLRYIRPWHLYHSCETAA